MSETKEPSSKVTYSNGQLIVLLLREAYERDLSLFARLLTERRGDIPKEWTFTTVKKGQSRELFINIPAKK